MPAFLLPLLELLKGAAGGIRKALADWRVLAVVAAAGALLWGLHETRRADGLAASLKASGAALTAEHGAFLSEQATARALMAARTGDHTAAVSDANGQDKACQSRVDTARKSASAITHMLNEPPHANPDPAEPELLDAGQLRRALGR